MTENLIEELLIEFDINTLYKITIDVYNDELNSNNELLFKSNDCKTIWSCLRAEIYDLCSEKSKKYKKERDSLKSTTKPAIVVISSMLTQKFGLDLGVSIALASVGLMIPLKFGINIWCSKYENEIEELRKLEKNEIESLKKLNK